jgi:hypothetical protein
MRSDKVSSGDSGVIDPAGAAYLEEGDDLAGKAQRSMGHPEEVDLEGS